MADRGGRDHLNPKREEKFARLGACAVFSVSTVPVSLRHTLVYWHTVRQ